LISSASLNERRTLMRHLVAALVILLVAVTAVSWSRTRTGPQATRTEIAQPAGWVAFEADLRIAAPGSFQVTIGRFFRASDGSTRLVTYLPEAPEVKVISIKNISQLRAFICSPKVGWVSGPMTLPPGGWQPPRLYLELRGLSRRKDKIEGYELYQLVGGGGDVEFLAPGLNFFALVTQKVKTGQRWVYSNVRIGEQPSELFEPPAGAEVRHGTKPIGIVTRDPGREVLPGAAAPGALDEPPSAASGSTKACEAPAKAGK
jgi:hypothetical protein